jgi:hypothetical protein
VTPWLCARFLTLHRLNAFDGFALHLKVNGGIAVRRVEVGMPQPLADRRQIYSGLQKGDRFAMPHTIWVYRCPKSQDAYRSIMGPNTGTARYLWKSFGNARVIIIFSFVRELQVPLLASTLIIPI